MTMKIYVLKYVVLHKSMVFSFELTVSQNICGSDNDIIWPKLALPTTELLGLNGFFTFLDGPSFTLIDCTL